LFSMITGKPALLSAELIERFVICAVMVLFFK